MKICPKCNKQYDDKNSFCSFCGLQLNIVKEDSAPAPRTEKTGSIILNFISSILSAMSLFLGLVSVVLSDATVWSYDSYARAYIYAEENCAAVALAFAIAAFVVGLIGAIICFSQKLGIEKNFSRITKLVANVLLLIFSIILLSNS